MRAAILEKLNHDLIIDEVEMPNELKFGQLKVKLNVSGICGSQIGEIQGVKGHDKYLPHLLGHEGCGTVLEVGPGVKKVEVGDLVVLHWMKGDGIQSDLPNYIWKGTRLNAGWVTTFNSHAIVSENRCTKINPNTDHELAALFGCAITTAFGVIENNAKLKMGESIIIYGSGGIGLNIIQAAKLINAYPIIAIDRFQGKLNLAKELGATHIINNQLEDPHESIKSILGSKKVDVFIDNTGLSKIIEFGYEIVKKEGRIVLVGIPKVGDNINLYSLPIHLGKKIIGSYGGNGNPSKDIPRYLKLYELQLIEHKKIITDRFNLDDINNAIESIKSGTISGRVMIKF